MEEEMKIKHLLLNEIVVLKETNVSSLSPILDLDIDICFSYCEEINYDGYIDFIDASTMDGKDALVKINGKGVIYSQNGGYEQEGILIKNEIKNQSVNNFLTKTSSIVVVSTSIATVVLGILVFFQNNEISNLKDQLNAIPKAKSELVGKWVTLSKVNESYYIFKDDNTWAFTFINSGTKKIFKGEYQLGNDKGVFLRQFGSQHWKHDTTYVDIKSGIGTSYMYIKNNLLIDNQEDYEGRFQKVE